ncbi:MAG: GspH/FimT family pseudopilin [Nitrospinota bacterium]
MKLLLQHGSQDKIINESVGFTLVELLVVIAITGIMLALAYPQLKSSKLAGAANMIYYDLQFARMQAITNKNNFRVFLGAVDTGGCNHALDGHTYIIHNDTDSDSNCDAGEELMTKDIGDSFDGVTFTTSPNIATYNPVGTSNAGTITLTEGADIKYVIFSATGRIRVSDAP